MLEQVKKEKENQEVKKRRGTLRSPEAKKAYLAEQIARRKAIREDKAELVNRIQEGHIDLADVYDYLLEYRNKTKCPENHILVITPHAGIKMVRKDDSFAILKHYGKAIVVQ